MGAVCTAPTLARKVLLTGPKQSGKTTLLYAWCLQRETETQSTVSFNVETVGGDKHGQVLLVFDVTDPIRRRQFFHGTEGIVYVVDGSSDASISAAKDDLKAVLSNRDLKHLPLILVISKEDVKSTGLQTAVIEKHLELSNETNTRKYKCMTVRKDNLTTYQAVLQELCALLYS